MKRQKVSKQFKFNNHGRNIKETDIIDELSIPDESNFMEKASQNSIHDISIVTQHNRKCLTSMQSELNLDEISISMINEEPKFNSKIEKLEWELLDKKPSLKKEYKKAKKIRCTSLD